MYFVAIGQQSISNTSVNMTSESPTFTTTGSSYEQQATNSLTVTITIAVVSSVLVLLAVIGTVLFVCLRRKKTKKRESVQDDSRKY